MEVKRLLLILFIGILLSLDSQAFGLLSGSIFSNLTVNGIQILVTKGVVMICLFHRFL